MDPEQLFSKVVQPNFQGVSALDIAGEHGCEESARLIIGFITKHFSQVKNFFQSDTGKNRVMNKDSELAQSITENDQGPFIIKFSTRSQLKNQQLEYANVFYWAGYFGIKETILKFVKEIGISPFIKTYLRRNVIMACIMGLARYKDRRNPLVQDLIDIIKLLVENSSLDAKNLSPLNPKYQLDDTKMSERFTNTFQNRDTYGNNVCHYLFDIEDPTIRNECLNLMITNNIGDFKQRNNQGLLPFELLHELQLDELPKDLLQYYKRPLQELMEGDYLITTERIGKKKTKENLIIKQLEDLKLYDPKNKENKYYHVFSESNSDTSDDEKRTVLISIDIPDSMIDQSAHNIELSCSIKNS